MLLKNKKEIFNVVLKPIYKLSKKKKTKTQIRDAHDREWLINLRRDVI